MTTFSVPPPLFVETGSLSSAKILPSERDLLINVLLKTKKKSVNNTKFDASYLLKDVENCKRQTIISEFLLHGLPDKFISKRMPTSAKIIMLV